MKEEVRGNRENIMRKKRRKEGPRKEKKKRTSEYGGKEGKKAMK